MGTDETLNNRPKDTVHLKDSSRRETNLASKIETPIIITDAVPLTENAMVDHIGNLLSTINVDGLLGAVNNQSLSQQALLVLDSYLELISKKFSLQRNLLKSQNSSTDELEFLAKKIDAFSKSYNLLGFETYQCSPIENEGYMARSDKRESILKELNKLIRMLTLGNNLTEVYKCVTPKASDIDTLLKMVDLFSLHRFHDVISEYSSQLLESMQKYLADYRQNLEHRGLVEFTSKRAKKIYLKEEEKKYMQGLDKIEVPITVAPDIQKFPLLKTVGNEAVGIALKNIPRYFWLGINSIRLAYEDTTDNKNEYVLGTHVGTWNKNKNFVESDITIFMKFVSKYFDQKKGEVPNPYLLHELLLVIFHEIAHSMHHRLNFEEMRDWNDVFDNEYVIVSWYVVHAGKRRMISKNTTDYRFETEIEAKSRQAVEDFAESLAYFKIYPSYLKKIAPKRFKFMNKFFKKYTKSYDLPDNKLIDYSLVDLNPRNKKFQHKTK